MRWYYKAMLMRPASALWDCHPHSVNVNTATLSLNVDMKGRIRWREIIINNRQPLVCWSSFLNNTALVHTQHHIELGFFSPPHSHHLHHHLVLSL